MTLLNRQFQVQYRETFEWHFGEAFKLLLVYSILLRFPFNY